ncbi:MAG: restriction endonuclease subunit S [Bacteroidota bacterium]
MSIERLGDLVVITSGYALKSDFFSTESNLMPVIRIRDIEKGKTETFTSEIIDDRYVAKKGDILISMDGEFKPFIWTGINAYINQRVCKIEPKSEKLLKKYLYYFLPKELKRIEDVTPFVTVKHLSVNDINEIKIVLPSLIEQRYIVNILDTVQNLISKKKNSLETLDRLLKDAFLNMFGDPVSNSKKWPTLKLSTLGKIERGVSKSRPRNAIELLNGPYPLIQTGDVANAGTYIKKYTSTYSELGLKQSKIWPSGTLCITIAANIGKTAILGFDSCFPDSIVGILPNRKTNSEFMHFWFSFWQKVLEQNAPMAAQKNINLEVLRDLNVISPDINLQKSFKELVVKVEKIREKLSITLAYVETLLKSLLQNAFSGRLKIKQDTAAITEAIETVQWLKEQVEVLPTTKNIVKLNYGLSKMTEAMHTIKTRVQLDNIFKKMQIPGSLKIQNLKSGIQNFGHSNISELSSSQISQLIIDYPFFFNTKITREIGKEIVEYAEVKRIIEESNELEKKDNDPILKYLGDTKIGNVTFGNYHINVVELANQYFSDKSFTIKQIIEVLAEEEGVSTTYQVIEQAVFKSIDNFIENELWNMPFTFLQLQSSLRQIKFYPAFELLNKYVMERLEVNPSFLQQIYFDETMASKNKDAYDYLQQANKVAIRRLYLKLNNVKLEEAI